MAKEPSIKLHPKYGVNPTMPVCFLCGKDTGEILLLGAAYKEEAPMKMTNEEIYCESCQKMLAAGATGLICYGCKGVCVISKEATERLPFERQAPVMYLEPGMLRWLHGEEVQACTCKIPKELQHKKDGDPVGEDANLPVDPH
jgi:hypothetical protein